MAEPLPSSSVEEFRWRLDTVENELRRLPQNLCVLLTHTPLTREGARHSMFEGEGKHQLGTHWLSEGELPHYPLTAQPPELFPFGTDRFPFGVVLSRTSSLFELVVDAEDRTWLNFGGKCGFYVSGATVRDSLAEGNVTQELTLRTIWHYFDENEGALVPKESSFKSVYENLLRCYRGILGACMEFEEQLFLAGDELTPIIYELQWPEVLLYLGWKKLHPLLGVEHDSVSRSFRGEELVPFGEADCHHVFRIRPSSVAGATSFAIEALRRIVDAVDKPAAGGDKGAVEGVKFKWTAPLLEGHVFALLKEIEYPTERGAVDWIAARSRKPKPSRTTLRKTYAWQNRPQKTPKRRMTNEAQSGVSPAQNADAAVSHEEVTDTVLDIEEKLHRQLVDNERDAIAWTLQHAEAGEEKREEAIRQLIQGFGSGEM